MWALSDVSFQVEQGEALGIVGHNGAGKTTTVRTIGGLIKVRHGRLDYNGLDIANSTPRERVLHGKQLRLEFYHAQRARRRDVRGFDRR